MGCCGGSIIMANNRTKLEAPASAQAGNVVMEYTGAAAAPVPYRIGGVVYSGYIGGSIEAPAEHVQALLDTDVFKVFEAPKPSKEEQAAADAEQAAATNEPSEVRANVVAADSGLPLAQPDAATEAAQDANTSTGVLKPGPRADAETDTDADASTKSRRK